jgi:hypothetical protein
MPAYLQRLMCLTAIVAGLVASPRQLRVASAQSRTGGEQERGIAEVTTQFSDAVSLTRARGPVTPVRVALKRWHLAGQGVPIEIREPGFYVAHLISGNVSTEIGGTTTHRAPGDFWNVEQGSRMVITINKPGEEALMQTFSVTPGR